MNSDLSCESTFSMFNLALSFSTELLVEFVFASIEVLRNSVLRLTSERNSGKQQERQKLTVTEISMLGSEYIRV